MARDGLDRRLGRHGERVERAERGDRLVVPRVVEGPREVDDGRAAAHVEGGRLPRRRRGAVGERPAPRVGDDGQRVEQRGAERLAERGRAARRPAVALVGRVEGRGRVLEGHLQRHGQRAVALRDRVRAHGHVRLAGRVDRVAQPDLEVGRPAEERVGECRELVCEGVVPLGDALRAREEVRGDGLVAVDIDVRVEAEVVHGFEHVVDLGAALQRRGVVVRVDARRPFPVQVRAARVRPEVPGDGAVRVHVRHDADRGVAPQLPRERIVAVVEEPHQPLGAPLGHGLAGVLPRRRPERHGPVPEGEHVQRPSLQRFADDRMDAERAGRGQLRDRAFVPLPGVGREVREPDAVSLRRQLPGELAAVVGRRRHAPPVLAVVGGDGLVVLPARRVTRVAYQA